MVTDRAGFDALEPEWNSLFDRAGRDTHVFQSFNWNWHWANHYLAGRSLAVVTARVGGRLALVWPLVLERSAGLIVVRWMGEPVSQYGDILVEDAHHAPELIERAWRLITTQLGADIALLRKVRADAVIAPFLRSCPAVESAKTEAPYLDLASAPDFEHYEQRYTGKTRKNRRRLMRRLGERGEVEIAQSSGGSEARAGALEAIALKRAWIEITGRISRAVTDDRFAAFFADVCGGEVRPAGCRVTILRSAGVTAAAAIDVTCGARRAAHVIVHDRRLESFSPGTLLLETWIKSACADGIATFDLLAPAYTYKLDWADGCVSVSDVAYGITVPGRAYVTVYLGALREPLKRLAERSSTALARLITAVKRLGVPRLPPRS